MSIDIESYVKRFAIAQFSDNYECYEKINGSLNGEQSEMNGDALKAAIMLSAIHAYKDLQLRTIHGVEEKEKEARKNGCIKVTIGIFIGYFAPGKSEPIINQKRWDEWHEKSCDNFCKVFEGNSDNKDIKEQKFGKAQKMINMTFKYLYCFDALRNKGEYFKFCHMPLDSYTLSWFADTFKEKDGIPCASKIKNMSWSKLEYDSTKNCCLSYKKIQCTIREYFESGDCKEEYKGLTPFQAEFYIWEKEKAKAAKAALNDLSKAAEKISGADNQILQEILSDMKICEDDCKNLNDCIGKICGIKKK